MKTHLLFLACLVLLSSCGPAPHGKAGLWNFTTTLNNLNPDIPPAAKLQMRVMGMQVPDSETHGGQICVSEAQANDGALPPLNPPDSGCTSRVTKRRGGVVTAMFTCTGSMKGTGQLAMRYADAGHYSGTYNFNGTSGGKILTLSSSFKASWAKPDCGA